MNISFPANTNIMKLVSTYGQYDASIGGQSLFVGVANTSLLKDGTRGMAGTFVQPLMDAINNGELSVTILTDSEWASLLL